MNPHLSEDTLAALATLPVDEVPDGAHTHMTACADCTARLESLVRLLGDVRTTASDEADEVFDEIRLGRQRDHILRRLEYAGRPARVIEFPRRTRSVRPVRPSAARWVAAAAAAGLVVGVYAGTYMNGIGGRSPARGRSAHIAAAPQPAQPNAAAHDVLVASDDEILTEVETALVTQRASELAPFDALTPRFRETGLRIR